MDRWRGRIALVTGASQGIGAAICKELVKQGMVVLGCTRDLARISCICKSQEILEAPGKLVPVKCDLDDETDIINMFKTIREKFDHVDVCINNAAYSSPSSFLFTRPDDFKQWKDMIKVNAMGLCMCTRESLTLMDEQNIEDGHIIHIGSIFGHKLPVHLHGVERPCFSIYNATKFMVRALADSLREEFRSLKSHIKVSTISPGAVNNEHVWRYAGSEFSAAQFSTGECADYDDIKEKCLQYKDITDAILFILSRPVNVNVEDIIVQSIHCPV